MNIEQLKIEADKWFGITTVGSILQVCTFVIWIIILLVIIGAPFWGWMIGGVYIVSHLFHFITWAIANNAIKEWRNAVDEKETKEGR